MNKFSITHFIPLIGPWVMATQKLKKEFDIDNKYIFSFDPFKNNQQHLEANYDYPITYLSDTLLPDYTDGTDSWMDVSSYKKHIADSNIESTDLMLAVPPCAGLSMLNNGNRGADNGANNWMYETVKWFIAQDDKVLCLENAPGLVGTEGVKVLKVIQKILDYNNVGDDYKLHCTKTTTENHCIPQKRHRTFLYIYKSKNFKRFKNINNVMPDLEDFLKRPKKVDTDEKSNHRPLKVQWASETLKYMDDVNLWDEARSIVPDRGVKTITRLLLDKQKADPHHFDKYPKIKSANDFKFAKLARGLGYWDSAPIVCKKQVNAVIAKSAFFFIHPKYNRFLTVRELMDLMGYPDDFVLQGDIQRNFNHICQSLPVNTGCDSIRWAQGIVNNDPKYIGEDITDDTIDILLQNNMKADLYNNVKVVRNTDTEFGSYKNQKSNKLDKFLS